MNVQSLCVGLLGVVALPAVAFEIAVPPNPAPSVEYAACDLAHWTKELTGTAPGIVTNAAPTAGVCIRIDPSLGDDEFRLVAKDGLFSIFGGKRGVIYGVYETLERFGGIDFLASWHTYIPENGKLRVPQELDEKHAPAYAMRNLWNVDPNNDAKFAVRLRCNDNGGVSLTPYGGMIWRFPPGASQCHTFSRMVPVKKYAATHPEYFCEIDGVRQLGEYNQLCLTNPEVLEIGKRWARERLSAVPDATHLGVSHNDHASNYCRCKNCAAVDAEEDSHMGTELRFVNAIADDVKTYRPDVIVQTLAYQYSRKLPKITRPRDNVMITLCSIECDRLRPFGATKQHQINLDFCRDFEDWSKVAKHLHIWDYLGENHHYLYPMLNSANVWPNLRYFHEKGVRYMFAELDGQSYHSEFMELKAYLAAKAMWNPYRDQMPFVDRFMRGFYGAGAPYVKRFWENGRAIAAAAPTDRFKVSIYQTDNRELYPQKYLEEGLALWNQAEAAVKDDPACLYNVRNGKASVVRILLDRMSERAKSIWVTRTPGRWKAPDPLGVEYERYLLSVRDASEARGQHVCFSNTPKRNERAYAQWRRYNTMKVPATGCDRVEVGTDRIEILEDFIARKVADPKAVGGEAIEMDSKYEHPGIYLDFAFVAFDPGVDYRVRVHADVKPKAGGRGEALRIETTGGDKLSLDVKDLKPGYGWYETKPFRPGQTTRVTIAPGHRSGKGGGSEALDRVRVDRFVIERARSIAPFFSLAGEDAVALRADALVRPDFAFDGVSGLLGWQALEVENGAASVDRIDEKGPDGHPVVRISGSARSCSFASEKVKLVSGEPYRLSARVRVAGFKSGAGLMKLRGGRMSGPAETAFPGDTQGAWRSVELTVPALPEARNSEYRFVFELANPKDGDVFDICDPRLEPMSEKAKKLSAPIGSFAPMVARVVPVEPLMCTVDATTGYMRFRANTDTNGCEIVATVDGKPLGPMPEGRHEVTVRLVEKTTGKVRAENVYPFIARKPQTVPQVGRKLNNFVTEVVNAPLRDGTYEFTNPRRGWVFVGFDKAVPGAEATLSGLAEPIVVYRPDEPSETLRHLEKGTYRLTVMGTSGGRLRIHLVKPLVMNGMGIFQPGGWSRSTWDKAFGWDFYRKVALSVTAEFDGRFYSVPGYDVGSDKYREFIARLSKRGKRVFGIGSIAASALATRCDWAKVRQRFCDNVYFKDGLPVSIDENGFHDSMRSLNLVGEAAWEMSNLLDPRPLYVCWFCMQSFPLADWRPVLSLVSANVNTGLGSGYLVSESYLSAKADPTALERQIQNLLTNQRILSEMMPEAGKRIVHLLSGWNHIGSWTNHHVPQVDEKVLMEQFVNRLANDPAFVDVGGIGLSTPACSEELARWVCRLMHHYAVEGRTDSISEANGWRYFPETVADGDFLEGLVKWEVSAAEKGSVTAESRRGFARDVQRRNSAAHEEGDFFALLTRSAKGPNRLSQTLRNLTPGKLYALEFATSDYAEVLKPGSVENPDLRLEAKVEDAPFEEFYTTRIVYGNPEKPSRKAKRARVMSTRLVFRAPAKETKLTFSDWASATEPGGAFGRRLTLNYISVNPYFEPAPGELE